MAVLSKCFKLRKEERSSNAHKPQPSIERIYTFPKTDQMSNLKAITSSSKNHEVLVIDKRQVASLTDGIIKLLACVTLEYNSNVIDQVSEN